MTDAERCAVYRDHLAVGQAASQIDADQRQIRHGALRGMCAPMRQGLWCEAQRPVKRVFVTGLKPDVLSRHRVDEAAHQAGCDAAPAHQGLCPDIEQKSVAHAVREQSGPCRQVDRPATRKHVLRLLERPTQGSSIASVVEAIGCQIGHCLLPIHPIDLAVEVETVKGADTTRLCRLTTPNASANRRIRASFSAVPVTASGSLICGPREVDRAAVVLAAAQRDGPGRPSTSDRPACP